MSILTEKEYKLFTTLANNSKCFDTHDNCFQLSLRNLASCSKQPQTNIHRVMAKLRTLGMLKEVVDIYGFHRQMVHPKFFWNYDVQARRFASAMFALGSHTEAVKWSKACQETGCTTNPGTGEVEGKWNYDSHTRYVNSYSKNDRDKIHQRDGYTKQKYFGAREEFGPTMEDAMDGLNAQELARIDRAEFEKWLSCQEDGDGSADKAPK